MASLTQAAETFESLDKLKYAALRSLAKSRGLKANGTKAELVARLLVNNEKKVGETSGDARGGVGSVSIADVRSFESAEAALHVQENSAEPRGTPAADYRQRKSESPSSKRENARAGVDNELASISERTATVMGIATKMPHQPQASMARAGLGGANFAALATQQPRAHSKLKPPKATLASRFARTHQNLFAGQRSIEAYGKTPTKSGTTKAHTSTARSTLSSRIASTSKPVVTALARKSPNTPWPVRSGVEPALGGKTVGKKPCTLVVQPSKKKPTQVKAFNLSSSKGKREGFTFKPYSGKIRPINAVTGALVERTLKANVLPSTSTLETSQAMTKKQAHPRHPAGIKATLASGKAQVDRRAAHFASGKSKRENKLKQRRTSPV